MIREDAVRLLYRMSAAWPSAPLEDPTIEVWVEHLAPLRAEIAADAVRDLEVTCKWFPTIAEFRTAYGRSAEYERIARAEDRGLPSPTAPPVNAELARDLIEGCRRTIDAAVQLRPNRDFPRRYVPSKADLEDAHAALQKHIREQRAAAEPPPEPVVADDEPF